MAIRQGPVDKTRYVGEGQAGPALSSSGPAVCAVGSWRGGHISLPCSPSWWLRTVTEGWKGSFF